MTHNHGCRVINCSNLIDDPDDDMGVCPSCCIKIARRYRDRIISEKALADHKSRQAKIAAKRDRDSRETAPDLFAAYEQPKGSSFVYYVRIHDYIKIGYSKNILSRLNALRVTVDDLLALEPGGRALEQRRHQEFDDLRITKRWENFRPEAELLQHVDTLLDQFGLPNWLRAPRRGKNGPVEVRRVSE